jgi:hypothetical protein
MYGSQKTVDDVLGTSGPGGAGGALSPVPKMTAYDVLLEVNTKVPAKDKITLDIDKLDIDDQKVDLSGTVKTPEELDLLVSELKKIECFKDVQRGPTEPGENGTKRFHLTISAQCM